MTDDTTMRENLATDIDHNLATLSQAAPGASLVKKLTAAMATLDRIPKRGHNRQQNYDYVTEADIADNVRKALSAVGVMVIPSVSHHTLKSAGKSKGGSNIYEARVIMDFVWTDGEERFTNRFAGSAFDTGDKAYWKAYSNTMKYALLKTLLLSTGEDAEQDSHEIQTQNHAPASRESASSDRPVAESNPSGSTGSGASLPHGMISKPQNSRIWAISRGLKIEKNALYDLAAALVGDDWSGSLKDISSAQASTLIDLLQDVEQGLRNLNFSEDGKAYLTYKQPA